MEYNIPIGVHGDEIKFVYVRADFPLTPEEWEQFHRVFDLYEPVLTKRVPENAEAPAPKGGQE